MADPTLTATPSPIVSAAAPATRTNSDLIAAVNAAIAEGTVDKDKCTIGGYSGAGYLSYVVVIRDSIFHFAAAVCGGGYTDGNLAIQTSDTPIYATHRAE